MEDLPDQWKESVIAPFHKKGDQTDYSYYHGISLLSTSILSMLSPYIEEIIGDYQCGF
jgi:hypothetical protein